MMNFKYFYLVILCVLITTNINSQSYDELNHKEIGLNMTPLIWSLTPLNINGLKTQPFNFKMRRVKKGRIFTIAGGLVLNINNVDENDIRDFLSANLLIGKENKKILNPNWNFYIGHNIVIGLNSIPFDEFIFDLPFEFRIGYSNSYVIEYNISPRMTIYTQTSLFLGLSTLTLTSVKLEAPVSIFLNVKF